MAQAFLLFCAYIKSGSDRSLFKAESGNMPTNPAGVPDDEHASSSSLGLRDGRGHPAAQLPAPHVRRARFFQLKVPASCGRAESTCHGYVSVSGVRRRLLRGSCGDGGEGQLTADRRRGLTSPVTLGATGSGSKIWSRNRRPRRH